MVSHNSTAVKWNKMRILYKGKRMYVKENPRKGICQRCGKKGRLIN